MDVFFKMVGISVAQHIVIASIVGRLRVIFSPILCILCLLNLNKTFQSDTYKFIIERLNAKACCSDGIHYH
jgi:hypothetical protein